MSREFLGSSVGVVVAFIGTVGSMVQASNTVAEFLPLEPWDLNMEFVKEVKETDSSNYSVVQG